MSAVVSAVQDVGNAVGNAVSYVGNAVSDAGNWVGEKVVEPLVKAVDNTIQAAIDDPIGTAVKIAAISTGNPYIIAAANTGVALANGADTEDALKAGAKAAVMYEVGSAVGEYVAPEAAEYFGPENTATAAAVTNAAASTAAAAAVGEDPYQALLSSGVNSAAGVIAKQVPGYDSLSANQQRALKTTVAASLEGKDPSQALVNQALQVGINYVKNKDDGLNYGYEQAPDYVGADQEKLIETIAAPIEIKTDQIEKNEVAPVEQQNLLPLPAEGNLETENIVSEDVKRTSESPQEVDALIDSGLTEDDGLNYGYEQAPDVTSDISEKLPETVEPTVKDEVDTLVDSGLIGDDGLNYGYEQAPEISPLVTGDASSFSPVASVDTTEDNVVPVEVQSTPTTQDEVDALIDSGLVEVPAPPIESSVPTAFDTGESLSEVVVTPPPEDTLEPLIDSGLVEKPPSFVADYNLSTGTDSLGLAPSELPEVFAPDGSVNYELVSDESGLGLQVPETPNLDSMGGGQGLTAPAFGEPGGTVSEEGVFYDYNPLTGNVVPKIPPVKISSGAKPAPIQQRPSQANTLDNLMLMMQGEPVTSGDQEDLINLVKASPYFDINKPLDIGFFDQLINQQQKENLQNQQGVVKMAEGGYMDIFFPKTQLTMDEILKILEGKYHG